MSKAMLWTILGFIGTALSYLIDQKADDERIKEAVNEALSERGIG